MSAVTTTTHPRFRARRQNVDAALERQRWARFLTWLTPLLVAVALLGALRTSLADVDQVVVVGVNTLPAGAVEMAAAVMPGTQLIDLDLGAIESRVGDLPQVASVRVERVWPSGVQITITERTPVAVVAAAGGAWQTVDLTGTLVTSTMTPPDDLPIIRFDDGPVAAVPGTTVAELAAVAIAADAMPFDLVPWIEELAIDPAGSARFRLVGGVDALFGDASGLAEKYVALATILGRVDPRCLGEIDVRVHAFPVSTRRADCE